MKSIIRCIEKYEKEGYIKNLKGTHEFALLVLFIAYKIINSSPPTEKRLGKLEKPFFCVVVDKQIRAYIFLSDNKYYSISLPLYINTTNGKDVYVSYPVHSVKKKIKITNKIISECKTILSSSGDDEQCSYLDAWMDYEGKLSEDSVNIIEMFYHTESGYIRYDYDPVTAPNKPFIHPANHLDINMTKAAKYKVGLYGRLSCNQFVDIVDSRKNCYFLSEYIEAKDRQRTLAQKKSKKRWK